MVKREHVTEERGRRWISGSLPSEEYFSRARKDARELARRTIADRLQRAGRPVLPFGR